MPNIFLTNWNKNVYHIARQLNIGVEIHDFTNPVNIDSSQPVIEELEDNLLQVRSRSIHAPFWDLAPASRDKVLQDATKTRFSQALMIARTLGMQHIVFHTGFIPKVYSTKDWLNNSIAFWSQLLSEIKDTDIEVHIENVYEDDCSPICDLIDALDDPMVSACLDLGHANANSSQSLDTWIKRLNSRIRHVHLHNNDGIGDLHHGLWNGTIDMEKTLALLANFASKASWTLEIKADQIEQSIDWLEQKGFLSPEEVSS